MADPTQIMDYGALVVELTARHATLSKRLRQVAHYCLNNPEDVAIYSIVEIAERAGVQPSTISRFTRELGFEAFSDLQEVFRQRLIGPRMSYEERLQAMSRRPVAPDAGPLAGFEPDVVFDTFVQAAMDALLRLHEEIDRTALAGFVTTLQGADAVHVAAARGAFGVGAYCYFGFAKVGVPAHLIDNLGAMRDQQQLAIGPNDVLLALTFDDYTPETIEVVRAAVRRGRKVLVVTDNELSPVAGLGAATLYVREARLGHFRSQVPAMVLCQSIIVSLGRHRSGQT